MIWCEKMYYGVGMRHRSRRIKWKIMHNIAQRQVFLLTLPADRAGYPEIIPSLVLLQKNCPEHSAYVIGLADGKQESFELLRQITSDMYDRMRNIDYYGFFGLEKPDEK